MSDTVDFVLRLESDHRSYAKDMMDDDTEPDSFWSERNQARLRESLRQFKEGKVVIKTTEELEAMENG